MVSLRVKGDARRYSKPYFTYAERCVNLFVNSLPTWDPHKFHIAREDVWAQLRIKCPSLVPMDCSAQFSEIFQLSVFDA